MKLQQEAKETDQDYMGVLKLIGPCGRNEQPAKREIIV